MDELSSLFRSLLAGRRMLILLDNVASAAHVRPLLPNSSACRVLVTSRDSLGDLIAHDGARLLLLNVLDATEAEELLVRVLDEPSRGTQSGYYRFHDLLRLYALERTHEQDTFDEREAAIQRLLTWYLATAETAGELLTGNRAADRSRMIDSRAQALAWLESERPNLIAAIRQALDHGLNQIAAQLAQALFEFFDVRKYWVDWQITCRLGLEATERGGDRRARANALRGLGRIHLDLRRLHDADLCFAEALKIYREVHDRRGEAQMINDAGLVHAIARRLDKAAEYFRDALLIRREIGDRRGEATALCNLGGTYTRMPRLNEANPPVVMDDGIPPAPPQAIECYEQSLTIRREIGDRAGEGESLNGLGTAYRRLRRFDEAIACYEIALLICRDMGDRNSEGAILSNIGVAFADQQQFSRAAEYYQQALTIYQSIGHRSSQAVILSNFGTLHVDWHQLPVALDYYRRSLVMFQEIKDPYAEEKMLRRIRSVSSPDDT